jgi:hypothetical protein
MVSWDWGCFVTDEESTSHANVRLVVFHHRGRVPAAGLEPIAARATGGIGAGATGRGGRVCVVWVDVVGAGIAAAQGCGRVSKDVSPCFICRLVYPLEYRCPVARYSGRGNFSNLKFHDRPLGGA